MKIDGLFHNHVQRIDPETRCLKTRRGLRSTLPSAYFSGYHYSPPQAGRRKAAWRSLDLAPMGSTRPFAYAFRPTPIGPELFPHATWNNSARSASLYQFRWAYAVCEWSMLRGEELIA
jgi:hypothetical protein